MCLLSYQEKPKSELSAHPLPCLELKCTVYACLIPIIGEANLIVYTHWAMYQQYVGTPSVSFVSLELAMCQFPERHQYVGTPSVSFVSLPRELAMCQYPECQHCIVIQRVSNVSVPECQHCIGTQRVSNVSVPRMSALYRYPESSQCVSFPSATNMSLPRMSALYRYSES